MNASPPTQVEAAATWNTSRKIASAPLVRACPAAEIVGIRQEREERQKLEPSRPARHQRQRADDDRDSDLPEERVAEPRLEH